MSNTKVAATETTEAGPTLVLRRKRGGVAKAAPRAKAAPKAKKERVKKASKPPFRIMLGRISASGKGYDFERHAYKAADEVMAAAQTAIDKDSGLLREIMILVHPQDEA